MRFVAAEAILDSPSVIMTSDPDDLAVLIDGYPLVRNSPHLKASRESAR